jgi:hypothetical protein
MLLMLETIKSWYETHLVPNSTQKKIASGGTFGEEDQNKLRDLDQEEETLSRISSIL